jgi:hypothetical protein
MLASRLHDFETVVFRTGQPNREDGVRKVDVGIGAFLILLGVFGITQSLGLPLVQRGGIPGPGMYPLVLSVALVVLGALLIVSRVRAPEGQYLPLEKTTRTELGRAAAAMLALGGSIVLLPIVGYVVSSVVLVALLLFGIERLRSWQALLTTLALPAFFFVVFVILLRVRLPAGIFDT